MASGMCKDSDLFSMLSMLQRHLYFADENCGMYDSSPLRMGFSHVRGGLCALQECSTIAGVHS